MKADTWMPLYVGDYMRDTGDLTAAEHGAYLLLIMQAWIKGGALPADDRRLRLMAKMDEKEWRQSRVVVLSFFQRDGDTYRHKRVDAELDRAGALTEQRRAAGKASAEARAKKRETNGTANEILNETHNEVTNGSPTSVATEASTTPQRNARPSQSQIEYSELRSAPDAAPTVQKSLWAEGLGIVQELTGKDRDRAATLMGGWRNSLEKNDEALLDILRSAAKENPGAPISWIVGAIKARKAVPARAVTADWNRF